MSNEKTTQILDRFPKFMRKDSDSRNFKLILSFDEDIQSVSDNIIGLKASIQISTSSGTDLDDLCVLFNLRRQTDETDLSLRNRFLAFWQANIGGGTFDSLKNSLSNSFGLLPTDITITEPEANVFSIDISVDETVDLSVLDNAPSLIDEGKAAGMYNKEITVSASGDYFLLNISNANGDDLLS